MTHRTLWTIDNDTPDTMNHRQWHKGHYEPWTMTHRTLWTMDNDTPDTVNHGQWHTGHCEPRTMTHRTLWTMDNDTQDTTNHGQWQRMNSRDWIIERHNESTGNDFRPLRLSDPRMTRSVEVRCYLPKVPHNKHVCEAIIPPPQHSEKMATVDSVQTRV